MRDDVAAALIRMVPTGEAGSVVAEFRFDPALAVFRGHFPGRPLLPGVFQIEMVRLAVERHAGHPWRLARVDKAKFAAPVAPGELLTVRATLAPAGPGLVVDATILAGEKPVGSHRLLLVGPGGLGPPTGGL